MKTLKNYLFAVIGFTFLVSSFALAGANHSNATQANSNSTAHRVCDNSIVKGQHGFSYTGTIAGGGGSITGIGAETCDDNGNCVGFGTNTVDGVASSTTFTGVYTINPDCTSSVTTTYPDGSVFHSAVVILNGGDEFHFIGTDPGASYLGIEKRR